MGNLHAAGLAAIAFVAASGAASAQGSESPLLVSNQTGHTLYCAARKPASAATEKIVIPAGKDWSRSYDDARPRKFKCQSINSRFSPFNQRWYTLHAGGKYSLLAPGDGRVIVASAPASGR